MRRKAFDSRNHRLLYLDREANERFWDDKWEASANNTFSNPPRHGATVRITRRYLPPGARILEGGCGLGDVVHALDNAGYKVDGIDYAPRVVAAINDNWPHLSVQEGDVRHLQAMDASYDGYWSIGVIEHFPNGYESIAHEMKRILRHGGYLFISFPSFNRLRQSRARAGKYQYLTSEARDTPDFFQFALSPEQVRMDFERLGFELVEHRGIGSLQGLAEESSLAATFQRFLDFFPPRASTAISMLMDMIIGKYAGHSCLLIFRKQ